SYISLEDDDEKNTMNTEPETSHSSVHAIHMPAPTAWPFVLAIGVTFLFAGLVTEWAISVLGFVLMLFGAVGWFRNIFPHEQHESVSVTTEVVEIKSTREQVARLPIAGSHRKLLPVERYTLSAGVEGGLAGGVAMIAPATIFGLLRFHSLWYAPNLLAAMAIPGWAGRSTSFLSSFHLEGLLVAVVVHALASVLVGLLYGAILPMFPWEPIATAGFLAPIFWSGLLYGGLEAVNPIMNQRIDWLWFIASQIAFGLVAGFVVNLHVRVRTPQFQARPFAERAGLISQGMEEETHDEDRTQ
ncbi:MAG: hypothetical protein WA626_08025, partial [Acidobacteriaceae bacterium]